MTSDDKLNTLGWTSVVLIVVLYSFTLFEYIEPTSLMYRIPNIFASIPLAYIGYAKKAYQPCVMSIAWIVITLVAILIN